MRAHPRFPSLLGLILPAAMTGLVALPAGADGKMFVRVDQDGTVHVTDRPPSARGSWRPYTPGDFDRWARGQPGVAHAGLELAPEPSRAPAASRYDDLIREKAERYGVPYSLVRAVVAVESGFNARATSRAGAQGLMQLMPATARDLGVEDAFDPEQNVDAGTRYLAGLLRSFKDPELALAAYNAGPGRVARLGRVPAIPETQAYVRKVSGLERSYRRLATAR